MLRFYLEGKREERRKKSPQCFSQVFENMVFSVAEIRREKENYLNDIDKLNGEQMVILEL